MTGPSRPLRFAVLTTSSAPGLEEFIADPNRGTTFDVAGIISAQEPLTHQQAIEAAGIPSHTVDPNDGDQVRELLLSFQPDFVIASAPLAIVPDAVLDAFPQRLIALHDGDLSVRSLDGSRAFRAPDAVREAIIAGEEATRVSAFIGTRDVAAAPLLLLSAAYPLSRIAHDARDWGAAGLLLAYADMHAEWMRHHAYGSMMRRIAELLAGGTAQIVGDLVWIDGVPGPCRMGHSPAMCNDGRPIHADVPSSCPFISR
jgi:hypothetical protein